MNKLIEEIQNYYKDKPKPTTVEEYCKDFPKGLGRTAIRTKYNFYKKH